MTDRFARTDNSPWHVNEVPLQIPHRNGYSTYQAAVGTAMAAALDQRFGSAAAKMPHFDLGEAIKQHDEDARALASVTDISPAVRVAQAHARKVQEHVAEAVERALQYTDHFEVHVYEWSTYGDHTRGEHKVVFNAAVQIIVRSSGGSEVIRHPYGEEPLHDERRD